MNFLLNMNVHRDMTAPLEKRGHVCRHVGDIGMSRAKDVEVVAEAKRTDEVIITHDLDYGHLLAFSGDSAPSVIILRLRDLQTDDVISRMDSVWLVSLEILDASRRVNVPSKIEYQVSPVAG